MNEQTNLGQTSIGTRDPREGEKLKPSKVVITKYEIKNVESIRTDKVIFFVKHPNSPEEIQLSKVALIDKTKLSFVGTWMKLDEDNLISKNSALAKFLNYLGAKNLDETVGKEVETVSEDSGYLVFKCY